MHKKIPNTKYSLSKAPLLKLSNFHPYARLFQPFYSSAFFILKNVRLYMKKLRQKP